MRTHFPSRPLPLALSRVPCVRFSHLFVGGVPCQGSNSFDPLPGDSGTVLLPDACLLVPSLPLPTSLCPIRRYCCVLHIPVCTTNFVDLLDAVGRGFCQGSLGAEVHPGLCTELTDVVVPCVKDPRSEKCRARGAVRMPAGCCYCCLRTVGVCVWAGCVTRCVLVV